jgi:hypothetical protein
MEQQMLQNHNNKKYLEDKIKINDCNFKRMVEFFWHLNKNEIITYVMQPGLSAFIEETEYTDTEINKILQEVRTSKMNKIRANINGINMVTSVYDYFI